LSSKTGKITPVKVSRKETVKKKPQTGGNPSAVVGRGESMPQDPKEDGAEQQPPK